MIKTTSLLLAGAALLVLAAAPASAAEELIYMVPAGEQVNVSTQTSVRPGDLPEQRITTRVMTTEHQPIYREYAAPVQTYAHHPIGHPNARGGFATTETTKWYRDVVTTPNGKVTTYTQTKTTSPSMIEPSAGVRETMIIKR